jgi:hypothetical protein
MALPSQNGPGYAAPEASAVAARVCGLDGAWSVQALRACPRACEAAGSVEVGEEVARHEAAFMLTHNAERVVHFAARGASAPGTPAFAALADPHAEPDQEMIGPVDVGLRHGAPKKRAPLLRAPGDAKM